jgi:hypothetical protein
MANPASNQPAAGAPADKGKSTDMLDLFHAEIVEESSLGKLSESLKEIDVQDLLKEAQNVRDLLHGARP